LAATSFAAVGFARNTRVVLDDWNAKQQNQEEPFHKGEHRVQNGTRNALAKAFLAGVATATLLSLGTAAAAAETETVVVTGSRIPHANITAPTAVTTVDQSALQQTGTVNVAELLRTVPSFGVSGVTPTNSAFLTTGAGISTLELRNLGEDRTLVLVNGKRYVSGVPGTGAVDFNTIPTDLIDRVEVITGGASAVYGSDALAGVINVILKQDFEGISANVQYGQTQHDDEITYKTGLTVGSNFANDKGNAVLSVGWSKNRGVRSADRANTRFDDLASCLFTGEASDCTTPQENQFSSFSAFGRFVIPSTGQTFVVASGTGPSGNVVTPFSTANFGFNRQAFRTIETPVDRLLLSGNVHYDITNNIQIYLDTTFANTTSSTSIEPFPSSNDDLTIDGISVDNPFVPDAIRDAAIAAGDDVIPFRRRLLELGPRRYSSRRDTYRAIAGVKGSLFSDYRYDLFFSWGHTLDTQNGTGQFNVSNFREALNAVDNGGIISCANPIAVAEGCVPINLFGLNSISPAAAKYIQAPQSRIQNADQKLLGGTIQGPVFALPAGDVQLVGGFEYRQESASDVPDALTQSGQNGSNQEAATVGGFHVLEFFSETEVPILRDLPFAKELTVGGAIRWSQYNTQGTTTAYTGRVSWSPIDDIRFRAQYARAVRAPNIGELFAPGGENFAAVADPCNGITAATPGEVAARCRSIPAIASRIAATGSFTLSLAEIQGTGGFTGKGNPDLEPERGDSYQFGAVVTHDFEKFGAFTASVDYFSIKIANLITTIGRQQSLDLCFTQGSTFPNAFCSAIVRDTSGPAFQQGEITAVNSGFGNQGTLRTQGIDFAVTYSFNLNNLDLVKDVFGNGDMGQVAARANWTWLQKLDQEQFGLITDSKGVEGASRHKVQGALVYTLGGITAQWEITYLSPARISNEGFFKDVPVKGYALHDVSLTYQLTDEIQVFGGVNNLFNESAPNILSGVPCNVTGTDTDASVYDAVGRRYFVGARLQLQ